MQVTDVLAQMGGLDSIAKQLGVSESQAATGAAGAQRPGASGGLGSMLDLDGDGDALDDILRMAGKRLL